MKISPAGLPATPSLLGTRRFAFQAGGTLRPGIKVLTKAAAKSQTARDLYDAGLAAGESFDAIEKRIKEAVPNIENPLIPCNVPYFTARRGDFLMPEIATQIMDKYAEDRGEGVKRLFRLPIVFAADNLLDVMPHKLAVYGGSSIKFWSTFSDENGERQCMTFAPIPKAGNGKAVRLFGGRKQIARPDTEGRCDPENCREYQARLCNVTGKLLFYIPGITSVSPIELPTHSIYGLDSIRETLNTIAAMRGGRISGFLQQREAFWLTKTLKEVPHIDEEGSAVRVKQWIIGLEVMVDPTRLLNAPEETIVAAGDVAADILQGTAERVIDGDGRVGEFGTPPSNDGHPAGDGEDGPAPANGPVVQPTAAPATESRQPAERPPQPPKEPSAPPAQRAQAPAPNPSASTVAGSPPEDIALADIDAQAIAIGIDPAAFRQYADKRWGQGWSKNPNGRRKAIDELESFRADPDALRQRMSAETQVFA
jgi:hypothetical protein